MMQADHNRLSFILKISLLAGILIPSAGCSSFGKQMKAFLGGGSSEQEVSAKPRAKTRFSETQNADPKGTTARRYRRMNKELFAQEGMLQEKSGSLWTMEGQGSYLFSQNLVRLVGDIVNVEVEGAPKSQIETKVSVLKKLLEKAKRTVRNIASDAINNAAGAAANTAVNNASAAVKDATKNDGTGGVGNAAAQAALTTVAGGVAPQVEEDDREPGFDVQTIPTRIVDREVDGSYRVKGSQSFMIGKKEYRVLVTGLVRPGDINGDVVQASRVLDSRFDVVSNKKETR